MRDLIVAALMASMLAQGGTPQANIIETVQGGVMSAVSAPRVGYHHAATTGPARFGW